MTTLTYVIATLAVMALLAGPALATVPWWARRGRRLLVTVEDGTTFDGTVARRLPGAMLLRDVEVTTPERHAHDAEGTFVVQLQQVRCIQLPHGG